MSRRVALVVDDSAIDREFVRRALEPGLEVREAATAEEAVAAWKGGGIDVIVLDLNLAGVEGFDLLDVMRAGAERLSSPVVMLTGSGSERKAVRALQAGIADYLIKGDVSAERLRLAVHASLESFDLRRRLDEQRVELARAERAARLRAERLSHLQDVTAALARSVDASEVGPIVMRCAERVCGAERGWFGARGKGNVALETVSVINMPGEHRITYTMDDAVPAIDALRTGEPIYIENREEYARRYPHLAVQFSALSTEVLVAIPMVVEGRTVGVLGLTSSRPRHFDADDRAFLGALAQQGGQAFERARLWREVRDAVVARDHVLSVASHDLRNPLNLISLAAAMLEDGDLPGEEQRMLGLRISAGVQKMTGVIGELLDVAALDLGQELRMDVVEMDLVPLARRAVDDHQRTGRCRIRVDEAVGALPGRWDQTRLERVIDNLLSNAIKYSPEGGDIVVRVAREEVAGAPWAVLAVIDRGLGIPAADLPHVFDRFHRARNVVGFIKGTGVGLSSARHVVEQHGGTIGIESREGHGTTVTVRLPVS